MRRGDDFEDDGASFRVRRIAQLEQQMRVAAFHTTPTFRLIRAALWFNAPFAAAFVGALLYAIGTAVVG